MSTPLLTTKLFIPPVRKELVPRPRLTQRLDAGRRAATRLTLVSAPAGYGKTTLLADCGWRIADGGRATPQSHIANQAAWLSLDDEDNDPARFLAA